MHQILIYNSILDVKYVSITNGLNTISWERINNKFKLIENWPEI